MAENRTPILAGQWALFVQPDGPNTVPVYLGCHDLGDIEKEDGDITLTYCPSPEQANKWDVTGSFQGEPSPAEFEITTSIRKSKEVLTTLNCPVPFYALEITCGKMNVFTNWESQAIVLYPTYRTSRSWQNLRKKNPTDQAESMRVFGFSANDVFEPRELNIGRQTIAETAALRDIASCSEQRCASSCGSGSGKCDDLIVVGEAVAGSPADTAIPWTTANEGQSWAAVATAPFAAAEDIASVVCFKVGRDTTRYLVARGTTDAGNPAEVAYSDDGGATWTQVNVGSTNGQYALGPGSLFNIDNEVWLVVTDGYIYHSTDGGLTWTTQHSGTLTVQDLFYIHGADADNLWVGGAADVILRSTDGDLTWTAATATGSGDDNISIHGLSKNDAWLGSDGGDLWFTKDAGTTWEQRAFTGDGAGTVPDIAFANDLEGFMLHNTAGPVGTVFRTINGGFDWEAVATPTNAGLNALHVCSGETAYVVGEPQNGTAVVLRVSG